MKNDTFKINSESLQKLGIDASEGVEYLENKEVITVNPVHVKALHVLKQKPAVPSS